MPNYIKTSQEISKWLDAEGITFEVDEFAPVVYRLTNCGSATGALRIGFYGAVLERGVDFEMGCGYVCPYFGPGGADNSMKALQEWDKKRGNAQGFHRREIRTSVAYWIRDKAEWRCGQGKTDGIALHDLLYKLMEEKK